MWTSCASIAVGHDAMKAPSSNIVHSKYTSLLYSSASDHAEGPKYLQLQRIFCGGLAGAITKTVIAPLERIKIIHQTQGMALQQGGRAEYHSISQSLKHILKTEGLKSLWNGNGANVLRVIPNYGLRFSFNDKARELVVRFTGNTTDAASPSTTHHKLNKTQLFLAGSLAGMAQITITYPAEVIFTRLSLSGSSLSNAVRYSGIWHCLTDTLRREGPRALYNGYLPTMLSGTPYVALQMSCYEVFQRYIAVVEEKITAGQSGSTPAKLTAGALAGLVAQTLTFPGDVVRKRMQSDGMGGKPKAYHGLWHATKTIFQKEGLRGFFEGVRVNTWRCLPEGAIMFVVFDGLKRSLDIAKYDQK